MLDNILGLVKNAALDAVTNNSEIPSDKKNLVVETATKAITSGLTSNLGGLTSLLSGKGESNSIMDSLKTSVVSSLMEKVGLNSGVAGGLVSSMLPMVISSLTKKSGSDGFSIESIVSALGGGGGEQKKGGGLLGAISSFLK